MNRQQTSFYETEGNGEEVQRLNNSYFLPRPWISPQPDYPTSVGLSSAQAPINSRIFRQWPTGQSYLGQFNTPLEKNWRVSPEKPTGANKSFWTRYNNDPLTPWGAPKKLENLEVDIESAASANSRKPLILEEIEAKIDFGPETPPSQQKKIKMLFSSDEKMRQFKDKLEKQLAERQKPSTKKPVKNGNTEETTSPCASCLIWVTFVVALSALGLLVTQFLGLVRFPFHAPLNEMEVNVCGLMTSIDPNTNTSFGIDPIALSDLISKTTNHWSIFKLTETLICSQIKKLHQSVTSCKLHHFDTSRRTAKLRVIVDVEKLKETYKLTRSASGHESMVRILAKSMVSSEAGNFRVKNVELNDPAIPKLVQLEIDLISTFNKETSLTSQSYICNKLVAGLGSIYDHLHCRCDVRFNISNNQLTARISAELVESKIFEATENSQVSDGSWCRDAKQMVSKLVAHAFSDTIGRSKNVTQGVTNDVVNGVAKDVASGVISSVTIERMSCEEGCGEGNVVTALGHVFENENKNIPLVSSTRQMADASSNIFPDGSGIAGPKLETSRTSAIPIVDIKTTAEIEVAPRLLLLVDRSERQLNSEDAPECTPSGAQECTPKGTLKSTPKQIFDKDLDDRKVENGAKHLLMPKAVPYLDSDIADDDRKTKGDNDIISVVDGTVEPKSKGVSDIISVVNETVEPKSNGDSDIISVVDETFEPKSNGDNDIISVVDETVEPKSNVDSDIISVVDGTRRATEKVDEDGIFAVTVPNKESAAKDVTPSKSDQIEQPEQVERELLIQANRLIRTDETPSKSDRIEPLDEVEKQAKLPLDQAPRVDVEFNKSDRKELLEEVEKESLIPVDDVIRVGQLPSFDAIETTTKSMTETDEMVEEIPTEIPRNITKTKPSIFGNTREGLKEDEHAGNSESEHEGPVEGKEDKEAESEGSGEDNNYFDFLEHPNEDNQDGGW